MSRIEMSYVFVELNCWKVSFIIVLNVVYESFSFKGILCMLLDILLYRKVWR